MGPMRKPFQMPGAGGGMNRAASGGGQEMGLPQPGRMNARPPMQMGGNGQPQPPPMLPMGGPGGGPTSPGNIAQMLSPQGVLQPEEADGSPMDGQQPGRTGPGQSMPMVLLQLMKAMGMLPGGPGGGGQQGGGGQGF